MRYLGLAPLIVWGTVRLYAYSDAGVGIPAFLFASLGGAVLLVWYIGRLALALATYHRHQGHESRTPWQPYLAAPAGVLLVFMATITGAAFHARFTISAGALSRYVLAVSQHASTDTRPWRSAEPVRVGLFRVRETEVQADGAVRMITTSCMLDDCGFTYKPAGEPARVGEDTYRPLRNGWWHWHRSW